MIGLGLATAVFVDATIVRMVLVPATMKLLGERQLVVARAGSTGSSPTSTSKASSGCPRRSTKTTCARLPASSSPPDRQPHNPSVLRRETVRS